jgi:hypothetical protein
MERRTTHVASRQMELSMSTRRSLAFVLVCLATGCVRPAEGRFPCETAAECPAGWYCRGDDLCWSTPGDAAVADDASTDAPSDAGTDAVVATDASAADAGPPECSSDGECPAGISHCVGGRCTFCAPASPEVVDIHSDPGLQDDVDLLVAQDLDAREIVLGWRGAGTRIYLHRTPLAAPAPASAPVSHTDLILSIDAPITGVTEILDVALGAYQYEAVGREVEVVVLARQGSTGTVLTEVFYQDDASEPIFSTYPPPQYRTEPEGFLAPISMDAPRSVRDPGMVTLRARVAGSTMVQTFGLTYLGRDGHEVAAPDVSGSAASLEAQQNFTLLSDAADLTRVFVWQPGVSALIEIPTADRSGEPTWSALGPDSFLIAYPAGNEMHLRALGCAFTCAPSTTMRTDIRTGSDEVAWTRIALVNGAPALLSAERVGADWRVTLRMLRADLRPLTAPGATSALVLDHSMTPDFAPVGRIAVGNELDGTPRVVATWLARPATGAHTLRLASVPLSCE